MEQMGLSQRRKRGRLTTSGDFDRVYRQGTAHTGKHVVIYQFKAAGDSATATRLGVSVSRRIGNAVTRNRVKRLLREAFWAKGGGIDGADYVLVARPGIEKIAEQDGLDGISKALDQAIDGVEF